MTSLGTSESPLRVAVVGSGPSGFYALETLVKSDLQVEVDILDRLPSPYGLVRFGVAPDHPKIKNVIKVFERLAARPNVRFLGNVAVGTDITVEELCRYYDAVVFANGAQTDRRLGIPGEDLPGSHTATEFVAWYNGHPDYRDLEFDLSQEVAVVIGQGNVAIDVCRILAKSVDELRETDIAQHALDALAESRIRAIYMVGRRGPVQAKFTQLEIKEMGALQACTPIVDPADLDLEAPSQAELESPDNKLAPKTFPILQSFSGNTVTEGRRHLHIVFRKSPVEILGDGSVSAIRLERNRLTGEPFRIKAEGTGAIEELPCGLVFRSVGYRGVAMSGVPFDERAGVIPNETGRVRDGNDTVQGLYTVGWIKRGPSGIIGTNKPDSRETAEALLADVPILTPCEIRDTAQLLALLQERGVRVVSFDEWRKIDQEEVKRGEACGKPREKFTTIEEMIALLE